MKWFKKLFREKAAKSTENPSTSKETKKFEPLRFVRSESLSEATEALETIPVREEVIALTTIRNFRIDVLEEFAQESDWVFATREEVEEPKFQQRLTKSDNLTRLCKSVADKSVSRRKAVIVASPPRCHCKELSPNNRRPKKQLSPFRRFLRAVMRFFCGVCRKFKCKFCAKQTKKSVTENQELVISSCTKAYLCR